MLIMMDKEKENVIHHAHTVFILSCHVAKHKCRNKGSKGSPVVHHQCAHVHSHITQADIREQWAAVGDLFSLFSKA